MKAIKWLTVFFCAFFLAGCQSEPDSKVKSDAGEQTYWIMTDPHYLSPSLHDEGKAFQFIEETAAGKDLRYQKEGLEAFADKALEEKPDGVILTGDLTLNGEKKSLEELRDIFQPLEEQGIEVCMMPGNHDIFDGWARSFEGDEQKRAEQISPENFRQIFSEMGFEKENEQDPNSLSYKVTINQQTDFYFLDTNKYGNTSSTYEPITGGRLRDETWKWLEKEMKQTQKEGRQSLVFMHHNLYKHNEMVYKGYVIDQAEELQDFFTKNKVSGIFSGHIHAQDTMSEEKNGVSLPEIVTASYAVTPKAYGELTVSKDSWNYERKAVSLSDWSKKQKKTDKNLLNYEEYLTEIFMKEGRQMGYRSLFEAGLPDDEATDAAAELMAEMNLAYFKGEDTRTKEEEEAIRQSPAYQTIQNGSAFLSDYLESIIQDRNTNDIHYQGKWADK